MNDDLQNQIDQLHARLTELKALAYLQASDISALLALVAKLQKKIDPNHDDCDAVTEIFLQLRKELTYKQLTMLEDKNPALAAEIQLILDNTCTIFPL
ncbi:unnamed protein product [marine sediment metagenome]|uniref:Uncharacterized protein n=1 Tax=marine sediment metagenome TaxID=412755 RepID=X0YXS7_9ZZZZ